MWLSWALHEWSDWMCSVKHAAAAVVLLFIQATLRKKTKENANKPGKITAKCKLAWHNLDIVKVCSSTTHCFVAKKRASENNATFTQILVVSRHRYGISALVSQTSFRGETSGDVAECRLFFSRLRRGTWGVYGMAVLGFFHAVFR